MSFINELKQRNVFRVGIAYVVGAWLVLQVIDIVMPILELPDWIAKATLLLIAVGFLLALILSWAYELTPEGVKKEKDVDRSDSVTPGTGRKLDFFIIAALSLALVFVVIDQYVLEESAPTAEVSENLRSIAVLPFTNRSAEEENAAFFADGIHDELLTRLSKIHDLKVISRTSVMEYRDTTKNMRQIGNELGVGSILEGGVQRAGDTVRINVQLIDAQTDEHLWADTYDRELSAIDLFAIQSEISTEIANALQATLSPDEQVRIAAVPTQSIEALEAYFAGQQMLDRRDARSLQSAIAYFKRAIDLDPNFAGAWSGLAEAWLQLPNSDSTADPILVRVNAAAAVERAIELGPDSADTLAVLGWHDLLYEFDWQGAERSFRRALQIESSNSNALHWYSHLHSSQGNHLEAITLAESRITVDPLSNVGHSHLSNMYANARRWDETFSLIQEILHRELRLITMRALWGYQLATNHAEEATATFIDWAAATGRNVEAAEELGANFILYRQSGEPVTLSEELLARLQLTGSALVSVYAAVGDKEKTIEILQRMYRERTATQFLLNIKISATVDFIRDDPRFIALLEQIGLAE